MKKEIVHLKCAVGHGDIWRSHFMKTSFVCRLYLLHFDTAEQTVEYRTGYKSLIGKLGDVEKTYYYNHLNMRKNIKWTKFYGFKAHIFCQLITIILRQIQKFNLMAKANVSTNHIDSCQKLIMRIWKSWLNLLKVSTFAWTMILKFTSFLMYMLESISNTLD